MIFTCIYREFPLFQLLLLPLSASSRSPSSIFPAPSHLILDDQKSLTEDRNLLGTSAAWQGRSRGAREGGPGDPLGEEQSPGSSLLPCSISGCKRQGRC